MFLGAGIHPAIATIELEKEIIEKSNKISNNKSSISFSQLPFEPDESWIFRISDEDAGYRVWDEYWCFVERQCGIRWWGLSLTSSGEWNSCDPEGMVFEIIFWDVLLGNPVCTFQVVFKPKGTFKFYNDSKMFYWEVVLEPGCKMSDGWLSIQCIESPNDCWFYWAGSPDGDLYCYHEGATNPDQDSDCAFELCCEGCNFHYAKIQCDSVGMNFGKASPGETITGLIYIYNIGPFLTGLDWFVDMVNVPTWGNWTFSPASGKNLREYDHVIINVTCSLTDLVGTYNGTIIIYNADDSTEFCSIDTSVEIPRAKPINSLFFNLLFKYYPMLESLLYLLL
jgi:hypothetical protein